MYFFVHVFACMYIHHIFVCNMQICKYTYTYLYMHTSTWKMTDNKNCLWLHLNGWFTHITIDCVSMAYSPELVFTKSSQNKRWGNLKKKKKNPNPVKRSMLPPTSSAVLQPAGSCRRTDSSEALHMPVHKNMYQLLSVVNTAGGCSPSPKPIDSQCYMQNRIKRNISIWDVILTLQSLGAGAGLELGPLPPHRNVEAWTRLVSQKSSQPCARAAWCSFEEAVHVAKLWDTFQIKLPADWLCAKNINLFWYMKDAQLSKHLSSLFLLGCWLVVVHRQRSGQLRNCSMALYMQAS